MHSLTEGYLKSIRFSAREMTLLKTIGSYQGKQELFYQQSPEIIETMKKSAIIESTESSNRLEGITAPHNRISDMIFKDSKPENRSEQEIAGYRDGLNLIYQSAAEIPLNINVILQLHSYLYRYLPSDGGKWKTIDNSITEEMPDGSKRVRFTPTSAFETPEAMNALVKGYNFCIDEVDLEPLLVIPAFVLDFLCIHPFRDGNGRTARLLTTLLLYHFGYEVSRYISLERIMEESKESYYETLEESSKNWHQGKHNMMPWVEYFWGVLIRAYKEFESRVGTLEKKKGSKSDLVRLKILEMELPFSISDLERACPTISRETIRLVLRTLRNEGLIESIGRGRDTKWKKIR